MKANVGTLDKVIRIVIAIILYALYLMDVVTGMVGIIFLVLSLVLLFTAFMNYCPIWHITGMSTRKKTDKQLNNK
ncbi:MAG: DUF2892 domain-containing protein [Bacteroidia bacterium]|jgi:hypothetical protein|nr:DUF2892 domain-containing protein [Bacteroidia bacterium]MCO5253219.1 DUF2892 domain-containing protein [Bacteroidota bacterium]MCZ2128830.1 DUF2892 domain-containing protein [Bacteroidia bacterium]